MRHDNMHEDHHANTNRINNFLASLKGRGYSFAIAQDPAIIPVINGLITGKTTIRILTADPESNVSFIKQLSDAAAEVPPASVLIVNNLGDWLSMKGKKLSGAAKVFLTELNFSVDAILKLELPVLFWLTNEELSILGQEAKEFFAGRQLTIPYFEIATDEDEAYDEEDEEDEEEEISDDDDDWEEDEDDEDDEEEYEDEHLEALEEELNLLESNNESAEEIWDAIGLALANAYFGNDRVEDMLQFLDQYFVPAKCADGKVLLQCAGLYLLGGEDLKARDIYLIMIALFENNEEKPELMYSVYSDIASTYDSTDDYDIKRAYCEKAIRISEKLHNEVPRSTIRTHNLASAYSSMAFVYRINKEEAKSLELYKKAITLIEALCKTEPNAVKWTSSLALAYRNIGEVYAQADEMEEALDHYQKSVKVCKTILQTHPDIAVQSALVDNYASIAGICTQQEEEKKAFDYLTRALKLGEEIYIIDPYPTLELAQQKLADIHQRLGDIYGEQEDFDKAHFHYQKHAAFIEELLVNDPSEWQEELSDAFDKIGDIYYQQGELKEALVWFKKATLLKEELYAANLEDEFTMSELSDAYIQLADTFELLEDYDETKLFYIKSVKLQEGFYKAWPESNDYKHALAETYSQFADFYTGTDDEPQAIEYYVKSGTLYKELLADDPASFYLKRSLAVTYVRQGEIYEHQELTEKALLNYKQGLVHTEELCHENPEMASSKKDLSDVLLRIAFIEMLVGNKAASVMLLQRAKALLKGLYAAEKLPAYKEKLEEAEFALEQLS